LKQFFFGLSLLSFTYSILLIFKETKIDAGIVVFLFVGALALGTAIGLHLIKRSYLLAVVVISLIVVGLFEVYIGIHTNDEGQMKTSQVMIVLGCGIKDGQPSEMLTYRLNKALAVYENDMKIIVSGGKGKNEEYSEAKIMADYLISKSVPVTNIVMEEEATNTYENLLYSRELMNKYGFQNKDILIVTSDFHISRAMFLAERLGLEAIGVKADTPIMNVPQAHMREYIAITKSFLFDK
jgi:uncharacterized SAM-binding protein YcdF (DUF218 family)